MLHTINMLSLAATYNLLPSPNPPIRLRHSWVTPLVAASDQIPLLGSNTVLAPLPLTCRWPSVRRLLGREVSHAHTAATVLSDCLMICIAWIAQISLHGGCHAPFAVSPRFIRHTVLLIGECISNASDYTGRDESAYLASFPISFSLLRAPDGNRTRFMLG